MPVVPPQTRPAQGARILVVEDERIIARDIEDGLQELGYEVVAVAFSGQEAINYATDLHPDLVLMDITLDGTITGIEAAQYIWGTLRIPIVYATVHADPAILTQATNTDPFGYVIKPFRESDLAAAVEVALNRVQRERELCDREQSFDTILQSILDGVIMFDAQGRVQYINPAAETLTGWEREDALHRPIQEIFQVVDEHTHAPIDNPITLALEDRIIVHLTDWVRLVHREGHEIPIADSAAPLKNAQDQVTGAVVVFRDVTQLRLVQIRELGKTESQDFQQQQAELERLNLLKDDFLSTVSHELRTPLTNIRMAIQMLDIVVEQQDEIAAGQRDVNPELSTPATQHYLEILRQQCDREVDLINDLLDLQRLNAGSYDLVPTAIELETWLPLILAGFPERAQRHQQKFRLQLQPNLPSLFIDELALHRILTELLTNACKYTPAGGQIDVWVKVGNGEEGRGGEGEMRRGGDEGMRGWGDEERGGGGDEGMRGGGEGNFAPQTPDSALRTPHPELLISICNTCAEISPEERSRMFEPFYRIPQRDRWQQGGTGLGLALIKPLATCLGGALHVASNSGQICFTLTLPLHDKAFS